MADMFDTELAETTPVQGGSPRKLNFLNKLAKEQPAEIQPATIQSPKLNFFNKLVADQQVALAKQSEQVKEQTWQTLTPGEKLSLDLARGGRAVIEGVGLAAQGEGVLSASLPTPEMRMKMMEMDMMGTIPSEVDALTELARARANRTPEDKRKEIEEHPAYQAGTRIRATAEKTFPAVQPESVKRPLGALAEGVGSTVSFLPASLGGPAGVAYMGALQNGAAAYDEARQRGANDEQAELVFFINAAGGTSEALPISRIFQRINKASGGTIGKALKGMLVSGLEEGTQEIFQQTLQNATAKHIYDEERQYLEGVAQGGGVGFGTGFLLAALGMGTRGAAARLNRPMAERRAERMAEEDRAQRMDIALEQDANRQALEASVPLATGGRVVQVVGTDPRNIQIDDPRRLTVLPKRRSLRQAKQKLNFFEELKQQTEGGPDVTAISESGSVPSQPVGVDEVRQTVVPPSAEDRAAGATGQPAQIPITAQAASEWLINITPPAKLGEKQLPGAVQVDMMSGGVNQGSTNPDELRSRGIVVPSKEDFYRLPKGRYTLGQAMEMLAELPPVSTIQPKGGENNGKEEKGQKGLLELPAKAGAESPPSSLLPAKQAKPLEAQRDQIRRMLTEIERRRAADDGPLPSREMEDALTARLKVIEEELYVRAKRPKAGEPSKPKPDFTADFTSPFGSKEWRIKNAIPEDWKLTEVPSGGWVAESPVTEKNGKWGKMVRASDRDGNGREYGVATEAPKEPSKKPSIRNGKKEAQTEFSKGEVGGMLSSGEIVLTSSGRKTTPFPDVKTDTDRKTTATLKRVEKWLHENAVAEAESRGDEFNASIFLNESPINMPQASKDAMEEYLFGTQPVVPKPFLKPVTSGLTPMMAQYQRIKDQLVNEGHKNVLLAFRLGDFYEFFFEDANAAAKILNIALTKRNDVPMAGVPYHAAKGYFERLLKEGKKVAVVDQVGDVTAGKPAERKVTEILGEKPATATTADLTDGELRAILMPYSEEDPTKFFYLEESSKSGFRAFTDPKTVTSPWFKTRRELAEWVQARQKPATKDVATDVKNLSEAELDAMLDDVFEPKPEKKPEPKAPPTKPKSVDWSADTKAQQKLIQRYESGAIPSTVPGEVGAARAKLEQMMWDDLSKMSPSSPYYAVLVQEWSKVNKLLPQSRSESPAEPQSAVPAKKPSIRKPKEAVPTALKEVGRSGMATVRKLAATARLELADSSNSDVSDLINWFLKYYNAGREGRLIPEVTMHPQDARTAYESGVTDAKPPTEKPTEKTAAQIAAAAAKHGVKGVDEAVKGLHKLFGGGKNLGSEGVSFDEKTYAEAKVHFREAYVQFVAAGRSLREFMQYVFENFGAASRPYLKRFVQDVQAGNIESEVATTKSPSVVLGEWIKTKINNEESFTGQQLFDEADKAFGGTQGEGNYTPKDAYDAMELAVNQFIADDIRFKIDWTDQNAVESGKKAVAQLKRMVSLLPTQTKRTAEMDEFQQFSTPPPLAYVVGWVANVHPRDVVLEPSAGIGGIAVFPKSAGATVIVNELSPRRAELLRQMGFDRVFVENGEQLNNILPEDVKPTVVVTNPPFSSTAGRMQGTRSTSNATLHLEQDLARLQPGGRLVAIVGEGMAADRPAFKAWWKGISQRYHVLANIGISGEEYKKYGTSFGNQIIVIDKPLPNEVVGLVPPKTGSVQKIEDLLPLLEEIRNERKRTTGGTQQTSAQPPREGVAEEGGTSAGSKPPVPVPPGGVGTGSTGTAGGKSGAASRPPGQPPGTATTPATGVSTGGRSGTAKGARPAGKGPAKDAGASTGGGTAPASAESPRSGADSTLGQDLSVKAAEEGKAKDLEVGAVFENYKPQITIAGAVSHPTPLAESAAMSSVKYPQPNYKPSLPAKLLTSGALSDAQMESVILAGAAHARDLEDGSRRGFFIGDGTGVGKGRQNAAILFDSFNKGHKKGVWITADQKLFPDAQRDLEGIGWDKDVLLLHKKTKNKEPIEAKKGVLFTAYSLLRNPNRFKQIEDWLGKDFDGVIVFDESHKMANAVATRGARGMKEVAGQALAGIDLQKKFPRAKIVYVSATGATEVSNLAYAERLGLWGPGTPYPTREAFINDIASRGVGAMEIVAKDLKSMGLYVSRNLSFDGVTFEQMEHPMNADQRKMYNELARAWQLVLQNMEQALAATGASDNGQAKSAARSAFWGAHQRFFNQLLTSLQMPTVLATIKKHIDAGDSVVLQLVNTNESQMERAISKATEDAGEDSEPDLETLDITPRETLIQYVENAFPVDQFEEYTDENGNIRSRPVLDSNGNRVKNAEAVAMREALINRLASVRVPVGALDEIIETFGESNVAEVTGRTRRVVTKDTPEGRKKVIENRSAAANLADRKAFNDDKKKILVFSDAGGTGASYHSDRNFKNQRKRQHIVLQPGWRADNAIQGLGRSHRSNQATTPHFALISTDVPGHKRFVSTIARRIEQLGALTKGQRQTTNQGIFNARDNLESSYAREALRAFMRAMGRGAIPNVDANEFATQTGLRMFSEDGAFIGENIQIGQFLNRLLSLDLDMQEKVFEAFSNQLDATIAWHKRNGTLDVGMETLVAQATKLISERPINTDKETGAVTNLVELEQTHPTVLMPWEDSWLREEGVEFRKNTRSGMVWKMGPIRARAKSDGTEEQFRSAENVRSNWQYLKAFEVNMHFDEPLTPEEAKAEWNAAYEASPKTYTERVNLVTGTVLPVMDRIPGFSRIARAQEDNGRRHLGIVISDSYMPALEKRFGLTSNITLTPEEAFNTVLDDGTTLTLANDWKIKRSRVSGEQRVEIVGPDYRHENEMNQLGVISERINYSMRYFIPTTDQGPEMLSRILKSKPIVEVQRSGASLSLDEPSGVSEGAGDESSERLGLPRADIQTAVASLRRTFGLAETSTPPRIVTRDGAEGSRQIDAALPQAAQTALESGFGRQIVFLDFTGTGMESVNGAAVPELPGVIFININSPRAHLAVIGHELVEKIGHDDPALLEEMRRKLLPLMGDVSKYTAALARTYASKGMPMPSFDNRLKELIADFVGDSFTDPAFWNKLAAKEPTLFKRLAKVVKDFLADLLNNLRRFGAFQYFKDVERAQTVVADALTRFAKAGPSPSEGAAALSIEPTTRQETEIQGRKLGIASKPLAPDIPSQITHAQNVLSQFGLPVRLVQRPDMRMPGNPVKSQWRFAPDGQNHDAEAMALADFLEERLRVDDPAEKLLLSNLTTSIAGSIADGEAAAVGADGRPMLSEPVRERLLNLTQAPASHAGQLLALRGQHSFDPEGVLEYARDIGVHLKQVWRTNILGADATGGPQLATLLKRLMTAFRQEFKDKEISDALKPLNLEATIDRLIQLNERDAGGRVYRAVQARLKARRPKSEAMKERQAKEEEAVEAMIRQAAELGKIEPPKPKNQKLTPDEQLALLTRPEVAAQIQQAMEQAIADAERAAGVRATVAEADQDERPAIIASFQERDEDGNWVNHPEPDMIEQGLDLPEFEHWRLLRDNLLQYSPTTVKAVEAVIKGRFRGTRFKPEEVQPPDLRLDLRALAVSPDAEVQRVFGEQLREIQRLMADADIATTGRVSQMFEEMLAQQLAMARQREVDRLFAERATGKETPEAIELLKRQINAGLLRDDRLNDPALVKQVAQRAIFRSNLPTVGALVKRILEAPRYKLADIRQDLAAGLVRELGLSGSQAAELSKLIYAALEGTDANPGPLRRARAQALEKVKAELSPAERKIEFGKGRTMWQRLERGVRAGLFDEGSVLEDLAREKGYTIPTEEQKAKMRQLAEEEMRLRTPTPAEIERHGLELATRYAEKGTESLRVPLIKQMQANWSRLAHPIKAFSFDPTLAQNRAKAINEFVASNLLLTTGFFFRQGIDVGLVSMPLNAINRSLAHLMERGASPAELQSVLKEMMTARIATLKQTVNSAAYTAMGSSNRKVMDRAAHSLAIFDRANAKATELEAAGNHAAATAVRLSTILRAGYRIAETWDVVQSVGTEWQEMRQQLSTDLKLAGKSRGEINTILDDVFSGIKLDMAEGVKMAESLAAERGATATPMQIQENAWNLVKARAYDRMRQLAGNGTNYEAENDQLKELRAWNLPETGGIGGVLGETIKGIRSRTEQAGVPTGGLFSFGNAIGTATNRMLTFMGGGLFGGWGFGNSPWYQGERNKRERRLEAMEGLAVISIMAALAAAGMILVQVKYPDDKDEKEKFISEGHKLNTVRFINPDGGWFEMPIQMSPLSFIAPALYMIGGIQKIAADRERAQAKLNAEAERRGLPAEQLPGMGAGEVMSVLAQGAYGMLTGGRTAFGAIQSFSDYGNFNLNRAASSVVRPYVPGLPAWGEAARAMGAVMDTRTASFLQLLVPTPWSGNQRVNALGDPLRNQDDAVRVLQTLSGGFGFGRPTPESHAYRQLFAAGYSPQEVSRTRGYDFGGTFRPMTDSEIERYSVARGQAFKEELQGVDVEGLPEAEALKVVRAAYARANSSALAAVGVTVRPAGGSTSRIATRQPEAEQATAVAVSTPSVRPVRTVRPSIRRPSRRVRTGRRGRTSFAKGPTLRIGRGLRTPRGIKLRRTSLRKTVKR